MPELIVFSGAEEMQPPEVRAERVHFNVPVAGTIGRDLLEHGRRRRRWRRFIRTLRWSERRQVVDANFHNRCGRIVHGPHEFLSLCIYGQLNENADERVLTKVGEILGAVICVHRTKEWVIRLRVGEPALLESLEARFDVRWS